MKEKKAAPNKSQSIRYYKAKHPDAQPKDIAEALKALKITPQFVSTVLSNAKNAKAGKKGAGKAKGAKKAKAKQTHG